jgi:hypothetical protein
MTTTLQYHDHAILRCDATTGHAAVTVALCRDTATARMLVDAYNAQERLQKREQVLTAENVLLKSQIKELTRETQ